jgi:hypothetical protein
MWISAGLFALGAAVLVAMAPQALRGGGGGSAAGAPPLRVLLRRPAVIVVLALVIPEGILMYGTYALIATDLPSRIEVVRRRDAFERGPEAFVAAWAAADEKVRKRVVAGRKRLPDVQVPDAVLERAAELCMKLGTDGLRGELTLMRAARALAALDGQTVVGDAQLKRVAPAALRHRLRRNPLDDAGSTVRVDRAVAEIFAG